jgi:hypothetical protein
MLEIVLKNPLNNSSTFSDFIVVDYECRGNFSLLKYIVFIVNGNRIVKEDFFGSFEIENLQENNTITVYALNKRNQKIISTEKTITFQKNNAIVQTNSSVDFFAREFLPEYIRTNYEKFCLFIEKYYKFLKETNNPSFVPFIQDSFSDIDLTPDYFLEKFYTQFLPDFPRNFTTDRQTGTPLNIKNVIKNIKNFYESKGTEKSFEFLFKIFYDTNIEIFYPRTLIHKSSDGRWTEKKSIKVFSFNNTSSNKTLNNIIYQTDELGKKNVFAEVKDVYTYRIGNYKIAEFFIEDVFGVFQKDKKIYCDITENGNEISLEFYPAYCVDSVNILTSGYNYEINDKVFLSPKDFIEIDGMEINEDPTEINIIDGHIINLDFPEEQIYVFDGGFFGPEFISDVPSFNYLKGKGFVGRVSEINEKGQILKIDVINFGFNYDSFSETSYDVIVESKNGIGFTGTPTINLICQYFPFYSGFTGILGKNNVFQDNYYYQSHSYEIQSDINFKNYEDKILKLTHPTGYKLFGKYKINKEKKNSYTNNFSVMSFSNEETENF